MMDQWTDRLSEYVDGELAAVEHSALEAHLPGCAACRATVEELRRVVARARALEDRPPRTELWPGIHARLTPGRRPAVNPRWRVSLSVPQLLAASIALAVLSSGGAWLALRSPTNVVTPAPDQSTVQNAGWSLRADAAVAELEEILTTNEPRLDTATVRVVRQNLALIDRAITEARQALEADPANAYLNLHLAETMRRKLELLRRINAIAATES